MTWIKRAPDAPAHTCAPPMRQVIRNPPPLPLRPGEGMPLPEDVIDGQQGDLWRCDQCGRLWRVGDACDACDWYGDSRPHRGMCTIGLVWRPATLWQRLRHRRRR